MTRARAERSSSVVSRRAWRALGSAALVPLLLGLAACTAAAQEGSSGAREGEPPQARPQRQTVGDEALRAAAFAPEVLRARRRALVEALPEGALVVLVAPGQPSDIAPYRPDPYFLYLTGLRDPGLTLLLDGEREVLFAPPHDPRHDRWNGPRVDAASRAPGGVSEVRPREERDQGVAAALGDGERPLFLHGASAAELGLSDVPVRSPTPQLAKQRQVKTPAEVALLQRAVDMTGAALVETMASIRPGQHEYEAQAVIEYLFMRYGAQRPGFNSIVGSGPNSCVLHYSSNRRQMAAGDLVVMDVGAELWGYTADVTRTVPVSGRFTARQRELYELVRRAQRAGIEAVRPGATLHDVDGAAREVISEAGYADHFFHGTSHWLGLDVHDVGRYERVLEPGMVLTVEPGVYLGREGIGIRIEDDVLVTAEGRRVLSAGIPSDPDAIEALMSGSGLGARAVAPLPSGDLAPDASSEDEGAREDRRFFRLR